MRAGEGLRTAAAGVLCIAAMVPVTALAGPPFVTDDPVPVEYQGWEINTSVIGTLVRYGGAGGAPNVDINYGAEPW